MSAIKNYLLIKDDANELKKECQNSLFYSTYKNKKYDTLTNEAVNKILKSKLVISESYYDEFGTDKVFLEMFMILTVLKDKNIKKTDLFNFGFKRSSVGYAIKKMLNKNIIDENLWKTSRIIKLTTFELKKDDEKFWTLKGTTLVKMFLLYGLSHCLVLLDSNYCFKSTKYDPLPELKRKYVLIQNSYFKSLKLSNSKIYKVFKLFSSFMFIPLKKLILIKKKITKNWINVKNKFSNLVFKKQYQFKTQRYISSEIKSLFVNF
ncbi:MAGa4850 family ICE element protein [Mycoplasma mycoides]|uniref:MarR family transcriptional regulator n=1 Tax=Mycoplasma mycoides subsp. capri TaxID=40477 RepID=A0AB38GEY4_MYCMC|nr:hypothetical protein [Mycoplasma mycoides]ADH21724.1 conserved hypothetical integrative conjugal element protein [synthetic Mycoplasma mycoides JCVI-syn1.0]ACU78420.1 conserved hypothetical integrative conjugal element protein [Mycoplasma mycoides subsp. capri str. GM12]ACU79250.1 conserved hypothetical integrative conjugal element protein [Mycoplasma mycoides subsp. capri str. GM12]SRX58998.1 hypothetical protein MMC68K_00558 [Mycoplasma mycoides subsp. capri]SRX61676.1 hypothetical protei